MHKHAIAIAAAALAAMTATAAWPLTLETDLTPKALTANHRSFTVTTRRSACAPGRSFANGLGLKRRLPRRLAESFERVRADLETAHDGP